jgi:hypothetical protein
MVAVWIVSATVLFNGIVGILHVLLTRFPHHPQLYGMILPIGLFHVSRTLPCSYCWLAENASPCEPNRGTSASV